MFPAASRIADGQGLRETHEQPAAVLPTFINNDGRGDESGRVGVCMTAASSRLS